MARKVGRPKGSDGYNPAVIPQVIEMGRDGDSKAQMARNLGISRQTLDNWCKAHSDFFDAIKLALEYAQAYWEDMGKKGCLQGKDFNATAYIFQMKNRFAQDYRDKVVQEHQAGAGFKDLWLALTAEGKRS